LTLKSLKKSSAEGALPPPQASPPPGRGTPPRHALPLGASTRLAPSALDLVMGRFKIWSVFDENSSINVWHTYIFGVDVDMCNDDEKRNADAEGGNVEVTFVLISYI